VYVEVGVAAQVDELETRDAQAGTDWTSHVAGIADRLGLDQPVARIYDAVRTGMMTWT
jgi:hypothetical protein